VARGEWRACVNVAMRSAAARVPAYTREVQVADLVEVFDAGFDLTTLRGRP
jgi:hypothetical protein